MDERFVLNDKSFKALSAESRVNILKGLSERRMTLSELSKKLSLKNSTVKEHCSLLMDAELVKKVDEGRKWKYYELTRKGKQIINPNPIEGVRVLVMLTISALLFTSVLLIGFQDVVTYPGETEMFISGAVDDRIGIMETIPTETLEPVFMRVDYNLFAISVITALVIGIFAGWVVGRRS